MASFGGIVGKVLFRNTRDGQEVQILFTGVDLGVESRDKLLALQASQSVVDCVVNARPSPQVSVDDVLEETARLAHEAGIDAQVVRPFGKKAQ